MELGIGNNIFENVPEFRFIIRWRCKVNVANSTVIIIFFFDWLTTPNVILELFLFIRVVTKISNPLSVDLRLYTLYT